jgi:hypothetical protein
MFHRSNGFRKHFATALFSAMAASATLPAAAAEDMFDGKWRFSVTPYLWVPSIYGNTTFTGPRGGLESLNTGTTVTGDQVLQALNMAAMLNGEVRKGDWSVFTDYIYLNLGGAKTNVKTVTGPAGNPLTTLDLGSSIGLKGSIWTLAGSYTAWHDRGSHLDVLAGFRYFGIDSTLTWNLGGTLGILSNVGSVSKNFDKWDGIVGVKGQIKFGDTNWYMPYYADVGSGSGNWTWQALVGVGYQFGWGDVALSLRSLSYDFNKDNTDIRFTGPMLSATFAF